MYKKDKISLFYCMYRLLDALIKEWQHYCRPVHMVRYTVEKCFTLQDLTIYLNLNHHIGITHMLKNHHYRNVFHSKI